MEKKSVTHEALLLVFRRYEVTPQMAIDSSKEQTLGKVAKQCCEADCHLCTTKPYSPWLQTVEGCIKQTKLGSSRKMLKTESTKPLWDHCIDLYAHIISHTVLGIYGLEGQASETLMTGQTGDI